MTMRATYQIRRRVGRNGRVALLALLVTAAAGCANPKLIPVEDFARYNDAIHKLRDIVSEADRQLEALAFDALVADARGRPTLRGKDLDPSSRWASLWALVDARQGGGEDRRNFEAYRKREPTAGGRPGTGPTLFFQLATSATSHPGAQP